MSRDIPNVSHIVRLTEALRFGVLGVELYVHGKDEDEVVFIPGNCEYKPVVAEMNSFASCMRLTLPDGRETTLYEEAEVGARRVWYEFEGVTYAFKARWHYDPRKDVRAHRWVVHPESGTVVDKVVTVDDPKPPKDSYVRCIDPACGANGKKPAKSRARKPRTRVKLPESGMAGTPPMPVDTLRALFPKIDG